VCVVFFGATFLHPWEGISNDERGPHGSFLDDDNEQSGSKIVAERLGKLD